MRIAIIGAGNVGGALGRGWSRSGHEIVYGVPNPADPKHAAVAAAAGGAEVRSVGEAVLGAAVVVLAVPWQSIGDAVRACGDLSGQILIDATNPLEFGSDGLGLALGFDTSGAETIAALVPEARVFKAMNQVGFQVMDDTDDYLSPPSMFMAGEGEEGRDVVLGLLGALGFEAIDAGPLRMARLLEPLAMLWIHQVVNRGAPATAAFAFLHRQPVAQSASTAG